MRLPPVDEADPALADLRGRLLAAVRARDWEGLQALMIIQVGYGPEYQDHKRRKLGEFWRLPDPMSPFWWKLERALAWGGRFNPSRVFVAPGLDLAWPEGRDPRRDLVAAGPEVALRAAPSREAEVVAWLSYDVLAFTPMPGHADAPFDLAYDWHTSRAEHGQPGYAAEGFYHVQAAAGPVGYVHHRDAISPLEHQAYIGQAHGLPWYQMLAFVAAGSLPPYRPKTDLGPGGLS